MIDDDPSLPPPKSLDNSARRGSGKWIVLLAIILVLVAVVFGGANWLQQNGMHASSVASADTSAIEQQIEALNPKVQALDSRVDALSSKVDELANAPAAIASSDNAKSPSVDVTHLQNDLTVLNTAVSKLQDELKKTAASSTALRAETIAYLQLRDAASSGHGFSHELNMLHSAAKNDATFADLADKLSPFADKGAPSVAVLREKFAENISSADQAIAKAQADTWWERIMAELKGLVSIRPLHGSGTSNTALEAMQTALDQGDLGAALDAIKHLPSEAQASLDAWRELAEARRAIDESLAAMADHLTANAAPAAQDEP